MPPAHFIIALVVLTAGCRPAPAVDEVVEQRAAPSQPGALWSLRPNRYGAELQLATDAKVSIRLICQRSPQQLAVNVPGFRPIGSEERMSVGAGGEVTVFVAGSQGDADLGGVTGTGPLTFAVLRSHGFTVSYGNQMSGPHPQPPKALISAFEAACPSEDAPKRPEQTPSSGNACLVQDGMPLPVLELRAVGTEPFWGARIEGRCVTYSHPDDQAGTRIWARFSGDRDAGEWRGAYEGKPFILRSRKALDCSDGMSDRRYPISVDLAVNGEQRQGCAIPL